MHEKTVSDNTTLGKKRSKLIIFEVVAPPPSSWRHEQLATTASWSTLPKPTTSWTSSHPSQRLIKIAGRRKNYFFPLFFSILPLFRFVVVVVVAVRLLFRGCGPVPHGQPCVGPWKKAALVQNSLLTNIGRFVRKLKKLHMLTICLAYYLVAQQRQHIGVLYTWVWSSKWKRGESLVFTYNRPHTYVTNKLMYTLLYLMAWRDL